MQLVFVFAFVLLVVSGWIAVGKDTQRCFLKDEWNKIGQTAFVWNPPRPGSPPNKNNNKFKRLK